MSTLNYAITGIIVYFIPTIIGIIRRKNNIIPIFILNLTLGWTIIGWIIALIWSFMEDKPYLKEKKR